MDITQNYFQLFGLKPAFDIDVASLSKDYRALQREVHPDKYANASEREKRLSVQYTAYINGAYQALLSPVSRANYLLELTAGDLEQFSNVQVPPAFLMAQVDLREALEEIKSQSQPIAALEQLAETVEHDLTELGHTFAAELAEDQYESAYQTLLKMQFLAKISTEIHLLEEELLD